MAKDKDPMKGKDKQEEEKVEIEEELTDEAEKPEGDSANDEIENLKSSLVRLQADFSNYKKRSEKEKADTINFACQSLIEKILPVLDNFDRAFKATEEAGVDAKYVEGFKLIQKHLIQALEDEGLKEIESTGEKFDPNYHEAVMVEKSDKEEGTILETLQKGYTLNDKVIRASIVKVSE